MRFTERAYKWNKTHAKTLRGQGDKTRARHYSARASQIRRQLNKKPKVLAPTLPPEPRKKEGENFKYTIVCRVAYHKGRGHDRFGEVSGTIINSNSLSDTEIIESAMIYITRNQDTWLSYVYPNEKIVVHIREEKTDEPTMEEWRFHEK